MSMTRVLFLLALQAWLMSCHCSSGLLYQPSENPQSFEEGEE
jgi:hypothetical protein